MFDSARIKLTAWYVLIVMMISFCFSGVIFQLLTRELVYFEYKQRRIQEEILNRMLTPQQSCSDAVRLPINERLIQESRRNLIVGLGLVNGVIFIVSGIGSFFLAGKTLRPIQDMVEEQQRFVSDASHELRTPLAAMRAEIEVALRDKKMTVGYAKEVLESNLEEVIHLQKLSDNLLHLNTSDQFSDVGVERFDITDSIHQAINQISTLAMQKDIHIDTHLEPFTVTGRKSELTQLFVILLENAIKYSSDHNTVEIATRPIPTNRIEILITDYGQGIDKDDLPYIFDRFYRAEKSRTNSKQKGYGLGLAIAKQIVENHLGYIEVKSQKNKGSMFKITLPLE